MSDHVTISDDGHVRTLRMNRPDKKNALTASMYRAMASALADANVGLSPRCMIIAGAADAFSAGNDLSEFSNASATGDEIGEGVVRFLHALATFERPLVAAVRGLAVGVGTTILMHCDHVVASTDARFSTPFVSLGLVPEAASSLLAPRLMGHHRAFELLVMGKPLSANDAIACGLVNAAVPTVEVEAAAMKAAQHIASLPPEGSHDSEELPMQTITTIGFDIAKSVFQVHGVDAAGQVVKRPGAAAADQAAALPATREHQPPHLPFRLKSFEAV